MRNWNSLSEVFAALNGTGSVSYIVLRNHEELFENNFLASHADIDFLCGSSERFISCIDAVPRTPAPDGIHYKILVNGQDVPVDIRTIGDGYYDAAWEEDMLSSRVLFRDMCYIQSEENYFYSLMYHALIQKNSLSEEYRRKLSDMNTSAGGLSERELIAMLEEFMRKHGYRYCYPDDRGVIFRTAPVSKALIRNNPRERYYRTVRALKVRIKKLIHR